MQRADAEDWSMIFFRNLCFFQKSLLETAKPQAIAIVEENHVVQIVVRSSRSGSVVVLVRAVMIVVMGLVLFRNHLDTKGPLAALAWTGP